jgi:ribosomal protein L37E
MKKSTRRHVPCRECGKQHTNPASSSICNECGPAYALANRELKDEIDAELKALNESYEENNQ